MRVLTVATKCSGNLALLLESARTFGYPLEVIGMGSRFLGLTQKLQMIWKEIRSQDPNELVMFVDAFDVVFGRPYDSLQTVYRELFEGSLVFGAESNCFPFSEHRELYPASNDPYPYINTGAWIGTVGKAVELLRDLRVWQLPPGMNDQGVIADFYIRNPKRLTLDRRAELFQCLYNSEAHLELHNGVICNKLTGSAPFVFHGNGGASMDQVIRWLKLGE